MSRFRPMVSSPTSSLRAFPIQVIVRMSEYMHDTLEFIVSASLLNAKTPYITGTPVEIRWASGGTFFGYVDKISPPFSRAGAALEKRFMTVTCVGATYPLKAEGYETYANYTVDLAIKKLVTKYQLASLVQVHPLVWPSLAQGGTSAWTFLVDMAKRVGYSLYSINTTLVAVDRRMALGVAPAISYRIARHPRTRYDALDFAPRISSGEGLGETVRPGSYSVHGTSAFSGRPFVLEAQNRAFTGAVQVFTPNLDRTLPQNPRSLAEAQSFLDATAGMSMFTQRALLTVHGNATLRPGLAIDLRLDSGDQLLQGRWYVLDVTHRLLVDRYVTELDIGKDAMGTPSPSIPKSALLVQNTKLPGAVFRGTQWTAAWRPS